MTETNSRSILPELHIHMKFESDFSIKTTKSAANSPNTMPETPIGNFKFRSGTKEERLSKVHKEIGSDYGFSERMKGLEEIGLFSEFAFAKPMNNSVECDEKKRMIHITDFMANGNKRSLIKAAGAVEAYAFKKQEFQKEVLLRDINEKKFFCHKEKSPGFFSPPLHSHVHKTLPPYYKKSLNTNKKLIHLEKIMEKCDEAIMIRPKFGNKSSSPVLDESESEKRIRKLKRIVIL